MMVVGRWTQNVEKGRRDAIGKFGRRNARVQISSAALGAANKKAAFV
jgi:hypothetical protein